MKIETPNKIFKYRSFDINGYYRDFLLKNKLYFSSPIKFNDPFDCRVVPNYEIGSKVQVFNKLLEHNKEMYPKLSLVKLRRITYSDFKKNYHIITEPDLFAKRVNDMMDQLIGVCTLTEDNTNILMWSHYSDSHKGFCVEYNPVRLFDICQNYIKIGDLILTKKVIYSFDYPVVNPYTINPKYEDYINWIIAKSDVWEYEKEWRLIYANKPNSFIEFPDEVIKAIYFGVSCSAENIEEVFDLTYSKRTILKYYKAKLKRFEFGIDFEEIKFKSRRSGL